jgi:hypothetical protein
VFGLEKVIRNPTTHPSSLWRRHNETSCGFQSDQEVKTARSTILLKLAANGLQYVFEKWVERCKKFVACQGRYFEKETVTVPPQSSDLE